MPDNRIPDVKSAIESGDADALRELLAADPARANQLIDWGAKQEIRTHPLHYVSDMLFSGTLQRGSELPLIDALLEAGADPNYRAANGETPLLGAASLNAEDVGLRLLQAGARHDSQGMWNATPLHWASFTGSEKLVARLILLGASLNLTDTQYNAPPIGWAIHAHFNSPPAAPAARHTEVVRLLVSAGANIQPEWLADRQIRSDPAMLTALSSR